MKKYFLIITVLLLTSYFSPNSALPSSIKVAAIFDREGDEKHALAFTAAIDYINDIDNSYLIAYGATLPHQICQTSSVYVILGEMPSYFDLKNEPARKISIRRAKGMLDLPIGSE